MIVNSLWSTFYR